MHFDGTTFDRYLAGTLPDAGVREIDNHLLTCLPCTLALEASALDPERWERRGLLGRLVRVAPAAAEEPAYERAAAA
jgi:hypothetical protein